MGVKNVLTQIHPTVWTTIVLVVVLILLFATPLGDFVWDISKGWLSPLVEIFETAAGFDPGDI